MMHRTLCRSLFIGMLLVVGAFVLSATCGVVFANLAFAGQTVDFTLTRDGKPAATIVTAADRPWPRRLRPESCKTM